MFIRYQIHTIDVQLYIGSEFDCLAVIVGWFSSRFLALVCLLREDVFEKQGLIEYNFHCFREAIQEVFDIRRKALTSPNTASVGEDLT